MNLKESAEGIFRTLQSDPVFEHAGAGSREILFPSKTFSQELQALSDDTIDENGKKFLTLASSIAGQVWDQGTVVRIKNEYNIEIRGVDRTLPEETSPESTYITLFRTANNITINVRNTPPSLRMQVFTNRDDNDLIEDSINSIIDQIPDHAKEALVKGILDIIQRHVDDILNS